MTTVESTPFWQRQQPSGMPFDKYDATDAPRVPAGATRTWPDGEISVAPLWVPVDLRDGNQSLAEPMTPQRKLRFFNLLVQLGYKEIEVGYPAASELDFQFVRMLAQDGRVPDDVTVVVFTPAREDAIDRTIDALEGISSAVVHLCVPTAPLWREIVLRRTHDELLDLITRAAQQVQKRSAGRHRFQFSPEAFTSTEIEFAVEVCNVVTDVWEATPERPVVLNLPATVETAGAHRFADQIEYMHGALERRDGVILSIHPHNDRGTGVAAAELGILAGAQRVEGCLFGNGERTGNVCLVTLALNVFSQGVDPMIDFSDLERARRIVEECIGLPVHPRHPYAGDLVFTAFSGTHQDAIRKGLEARETTGGRWRVPYVPVDPADLGRPHDRLIRVNSQSGKSGVAHVLRSVSGLFPPVELQREFSVAVQEAAEAHGEIPPPVLWQAFQEVYCFDDPADRVERWSDGPGGDPVAHVTFDGTPVTVAVPSADPVAAAVALTAGEPGEPLTVLDIVHQTTSVPGRPAAACYAKVTTGGRTGWGVATADDPGRASFAAVLAARRCLRRGGTEALVAALHRHAGPG